MTNSTITTILGRISIRIRIPWLNVFIGEGEFIDLEKTFKKQFDNLDSDLLEVICSSNRFYIQSILIPSDHKFHSIFNGQFLQNSDNPALRRLSTRRETITAVMDRRKSYKMPSGKYLISCYEIQESQHGRFPSDIHKVNLVLNCRSGSSKCYIQRARWQSARYLWNS